MKNIFVFVVCGAKEHIDTLHFSLERLKKYSQSGIKIITDSTRNEIPIKHDDIIDIKTDEKYNHHQASIFLKTGIHKFLPVGPKYCYLDTDVVALNREVDLIFNEYLAPITFAPDHCKVLKFSPYSVNCGCKEISDENSRKFETASNKYDKNKKIIDPDTLQRQKQLLNYFEYLKSNFFQKILTAFRYFLSIKKFNLNQDFYFDKKERKWMDKLNNKVVLFEVPLKKIEEETGFKYNKWTQKWLDSQNKNIWLCQCNHLSEYILDTFQINITNKNWQHWNGGVFLFDEKSHNFLNAWHNKTMHIFTLDKWKTRDQGTLIATAWEFGLQNHKTLNKKWNFIADYNKQGLDFKQSGVFTDDFWKNEFNPSLIHIYHHWGDETWSLWNWVLTKQE